MKHSISRLLKENGIEIGKSKRPSETKVQTAFYNKIVNNICKNLLPKMRNWRIIPP